MKNNTQQKTSNYKTHRNILFPLLEKENLTDVINLPAPPQFRFKPKKYNQLDIQFTRPPGNIPLSKIEIQNIFLTKAKKMTPKYYNKTLSSNNINHGNKNETKPMKPDIVLGIKTLLQYFRNFYSTTINENTDL